MQRYAKTMDLDEQIRLAKLRAQKLDLARDTIEWQAILRACQIAYIGNFADVAAINTYLTEFENNLKFS
jgi:hypothetical protein